jgi:hypothetical protein
MNSMTTGEAAFFENDEPLIVVEEADPAQVHRVLDARSRSLLGITGAEFLHRLAAGDYAGQDTIALGELVSIAGLLD